MDERELLNLVGAERKSALGFDNDEELSSDREKALEYARGVMKDMPTLPNRSSVTDSSIGDAVRTVLPDLMEMFVGGDDIATFQPKGEEDEKAAEQETDYVNHVLMERNDGFKHLYAAFLGCAADQDRRVQMVVGRLRGPAGRGLHRHLVHANPDAASRWLEHRGDDAIG